MTSPTKSRAFLNAGNAQEMPFSGTMKRSRKMKKIIPIIFTLLFFSIGTAGVIELNIIYPVEGDTISAALIDSNYIFGRMLPPEAKLLINGKAVAVRKNGAFLDFLPLDHGLFTYSCQATLGRDTVLVQRTVFTSPLGEAINRDSAAIDLASLRPASNLGLLPGDVVEFLFRGAPGGHAWCSIDSIAEPIPMRAAQRQSKMYWGESVFGGGGMLPASLDSSLYQGSYVVQATDLFDSTRIHFYLVDQNNDTTCVTAPGRLSVLDAGVPLLAETANDLTILRTGPRKSYYYFLPRGVQLWLDGKVGRSFRVRLAENLHAWVEDYKVSLLPPGVAPKRRYLQLVRTQSFARTSRVLVYTGARLPFRIQQIASPQSLVVYFYGVTADTDWMRRDFGDPLIGDMRWSQVSDGVYSLTIALNQKNQWGYNADYDENDNFILDIKKAPHVGRRRRTALRNLKILLDPGHDPDTGAVGPTGLQEREANLLLAGVLADKLTKKGAIVEWTRGAHDGLPLGERLSLAMHSDADILLSLHHNAVPAGVNPMKNHGSSTYYYHPQSYELARRIHGEILKALKLHDFGFYWDNLAMCRPTQMPAVLIEPAFIMHPEEEELINSHAYQEKCADAIVKALQMFALEFGNK